ncbi:DoxX family membrane protein [Staphylococcus epidermidis]|nr:DoxX family membrane protein [Staphylococcus epidermidis]
MAQLMTRPSIIDTQTALMTGSSRSSGVTFTTKAALVLLRVTLALLMLRLGQDSIRNRHRSQDRKPGRPGLSGLCSHLGEVVAPLLLLVGLWVVPAALVIAVNMLVAFALMHTRQILMLNNTGGWALG